MPRGQEGERRQVDYAETRRPKNPSLRIDHGHRIILLAHLALYRKKVSILPIPLHQR